MKFDKLKVHDFIKQPIAYYVLYLGFNDPILFWVGVYLVLDPFELNINFNN